MDWQQATHSMKPPWITIGMVLALWWAVPGVRQAVSGVLPKRVTLLSHHTSIFFSSESFNAFWGPWVNHKWVAASGHKNMYYRFQCWSHNITLNNDSTVRAHNFLYAHYLTVLCKCATATRSDRTLYLIDALALRWSSSQQVLLSKFWFTPFSTKADLGPDWSLWLILNQLFAFRKTKSLHSGKLVTEWHKCFHGPQSRTVHLRGKLFVTNKTNSTNCHLKKTKKTELV